MIAEQASALAASEARLASLESDNERLRLAFDDTDEQASVHWYGEWVEYKRRAEVAEQSLAEAVKDAARYRWLRDNVWAGWMQAEGFYLNCDEPETEWDAAIDALLPKGEGAANG